MLSHLAVTRSLARPARCALPTPSPALRALSTSAPLLRPSGLSAHEPLDVLMVGAGYAMFGTPEGRWNLSRRIESKVGGRLRVGAVVDPDTKRAEGNLRAKLEGTGTAAVSASYEGAQVLGEVEEVRRRVDRGEIPEPKAILCATPPTYRGGLSSPRDLDLRISSLFPNANIFFEKPVATSTPWEKSVDEAKEVGRRLAKNHKGVIAVGYVCRYLEGVRRMREVIEQEGLKVMAVNCRFVTAYELAIKTDWWNKGVIQGPIIEQGTHIVDLCRYFGGEVDMDTIAAHALEAHEGPGHLSKKGFDESVIPDDQRIPRATTASWKFESGAVGMMLHAIALHGVEYSIEIQVFADGYQMILSDLWGVPTLAIRRPGSDVSEIITTEGDDPYQTEMNHFIDAIEGGPTPDILSTYEDAVRSYEMTWHIRNQSEEMTQRQLAKRGRSA